VIWARNPAAVPSLWVFSRPNLLFKVHSSPQIIPLLGWTRNNVAV
jgi:hypothetical protein